MVGAIEENCDVEMIAHDAARAAAYLCEENYGDCPKVEIVCPPSQSETNFTYVRKDFVAPRLNRCHACVPRLCYLRIFLPRHASVTFASSCRRLRGTFLKGSCSITE